MSDCLRSLITLQITGGKKHSEERATLFDVRVNLSCYVFITYHLIISGNSGRKSLDNPLLPASKVITIRCSLPSEI